MLEEIVLFLMHFPHNMCFRIGDHEFAGTRYRHIGHFPWKGPKSHYRYMDDLAKQETFMADLEFLHWNREWTLEQIHMRFSWALVFSVISCALQVPVYPTWRKSKEQARRTSERARRPSESSSGI
jgi:hypothetical protein